MTWFKVDDKLHDHRKARAAGKAAMGVWVLAGSWSADNLSDGFIPASILIRWGNARDAAKLCAVGLWYPDEQDGEHGWRFHEWEERQPTREQKMAERSARAEAGKAGGLASGRSRREAKANQSASQLLEPPTRPDQYTPKGVSSDKSDPDDNPSPEVVELCDHLAAKVRQNGHKGTVGKLWHRACRLLIEADGHSPDQVRKAIDWATADPFWSANIQSMPKLREKYSTLQAQAVRKDTGKPRVMVRNGVQQEVTW